MARPVSIVTSGGEPVVHVAGLDGGEPLTPVEAPEQGWPIILVAAGLGRPVNLVNVDGTAWVAP